MSKKLMSLVLGSLFVAQMSLVAADTHASEQTKEAKQEEVVVAQEIQKLVEDAEQAGLSNEAAKALVVEKVEQEVKAMTGASMLSARNKKIVACVAAGLAVTAAAVAVILCVKNHKKAVVTTTAPVTTPAVSAPVATEPDLVSHRTRSKTKKQ
jgi:hypothetical protein